MKLLRVQFENMRDILQNIDGMVQKIDSVV